ncbi:hypothetical protein Scep_002673 [Stephania cephalantha]|uniref:Uncharacterized protein n=1 Tax=Stephania cephalantha TaxID=152367 RepID=A0AAP0Q4I6_9MAGN
MELRGELRRLGTHFKFFEGSNRLGQACELSVEQQQTGEGEDRRLPLSGSATLLAHFVCLDFCCIIMVYVILGCTLG